MVPYFIRLNTTFRDRVDVYRSNSLMWALAHHEPTSSATLLVPIDVDTATRPARRTLHSHSSKIAYYKDEDPAGNDRCPRGRAAMAFNSGGLFRAAVLSSHQKGRQNNGRNLRTRRTPAVTNKDDFLPPTEPSHSLSSLFNPAASAGGPAPAQDSLFLFVIVASR